MRGGGQGGSLSLTQSLAFMGARPCGPCWPGLSGGVSDLTGGISRGKDPAGGGGRALSAGDYREPLPLHLDRLTLMDQADILRCSYADAWSCQV